jgi:hypothetical protein
MEPTSFEQWKVQMGAGIEEIIGLEKGKHELAEHLFFLDLHQKATFRQYQKLIAKIGSFLPNTETRKQTPVSCPDTRIPFTSDIESRVALVKAKSSRARADFQQRKEMLMISKQKCEILKQISVPDLDTRPIPPSPVITAEEIIALRSQEISRKLKHRKLFEKYLREMEVMKLLEQRLQEELKILTKMGVDLVRARKWHLSSLSPPQRICWAVHREGFSID